MAGAERDLSTLSDQELRDIARALEAVRRQYEDMTRASTARMRKAASKLSREQLWKRRFPYSELVDLVFREEHVR